MTFSTIKKSAQFVLFACLVSLNLPSTAFAGGGVSTSPAPSSCGNWNTVRRITFPRSSFGNAYAGTIFLLPKNKPTKIQGYSVKLKDSNGREIVYTTGSNGVFQFLQLGGGGYYDVSIKKAGHVFSSSDSYSMRDGVANENLWVSTCR